MNSTPSLQQLEQHDEFMHRHIGPDPQESASMLDSLGLASLDEMVRTTLPEAIQLDAPLALPEARTEAELLQRLQQFAAKNTINRSFIGCGYYGTLTPNVILRNVMENPGWYTAYTPYQPEIAQGRLEALLNFQQMVVDLTGMDMANASLLDEATAAAEAMTLCKRANRKKSNLFFVADDVHPQTLDVIRTRAEYFGFDVVSGNPLTDLDQHDLFGALLQYPGTYGDIHDIEPLIEKIHAQKALVAVATDLLSLVQLKTPGEMGADVVLGNAQRFGVPMGFGGPHAAFFATREQHKRSAPGRIIGVSIDTRGNQALRMAMQTREQHIRREKATSNICTAQALLANMAAFYAIYHGPQGLKRIADRVQRQTTILAHALQEAGLRRCNTHFFDTLTFDVGTQQATLLKQSSEQGLNLRQIGDSRVGISLDETTTRADLQALYQLLSGDPAATLDIDSLDASVDPHSAIPASLMRSSSYLTHPVFNSHHSETEMLRYLKKLENKDFSLTHGMIPLGSCTMKLNATVQMIPVTWPAFAQIHPFAPRDQVQGYAELIDELEAWLAEITGYDAISMQPNSGAQGEYAGLLAIRKYQESLGESGRNICLIPSSAHGTNPASAAMAALKVIVVECDDNGNVDIDDLRTKAEKHREALSCLMITYPSTHGVYEQGIGEICQIIHDNGGQVYMDGANMNAQVGLCKPGLIGSDVSHLNLHKTFAIPHGGGGPGMGPIGVKSHLAPFLPNHCVRPLAAASDAIQVGAVSATPFGSASILPISWAYIAGLGREGVRRATQVAILNANYLTQQLSEHYSVLYRGSNARVAHECIIDIRPIKEACGISEEDIAKRLMDYGFHAPTMSFPVAGTLMIEPTESESKAELDRFIEAMVSIRGEIERVASGALPADNNPLKNAPHTQADITEGDWSRPYSREEAVFPVPSLKDGKFWPTVNRIDNVYGDRNLNCTCPTIDSYR